MNMKEKVVVSRLMTKNLVVASLDSTFSQVIEFFTKFNAHHLPVTFDNKLIGVLSSNDVIQFVKKSIESGESFDAKKLDETFHVKDIMTHDVVSLHPDDTIEKAVEILAVNKFQSLPVVKDGLIFGLVTNKDLVQGFKWYFDNE